VVLVVVAALVGAGASTLVARATGWGTQTVVQRYVAIVERPGHGDATVAAADDHD
jgi:hypothetical protein